MTQPTGIAFRSVPFVGVRTGMDPFVRGKLQIEPARPDPFGRSETHAIFLYPVDVLVLDASIPRGLQC